MMPSPKPITQTDQDEQEPYNDAEGYFGQILKVAFQKSTAVHPLPLISHHPNRQWCKMAFRTRTKMNKNHTMMRRAILDKSIKVAFQNSTAVHPLISHHPNRPRWTRTIQWCGGYFGQILKVAFQKSDSIKVHPLTYLPPTRTQTDKPSMNKNHTMNHTMMRRAILDKS